MTKPHRADLKVGDEVSYAMPASMLYGTVTRVLGAGDQAAVEIEFEDGRKEIKKVKDRSIGLVRRASGKSEVDERYSDRTKVRDPDIERVRRSEQRKRY